MRRCIFYIAFYGYSIAGMRLLNNIHTAYFNCIQLGILYTIKIKP